MLMVWDAFGLGCFWFGMLPYPTNQRPSFEAGPVHSMGDLH